MLLVIDVGNTNMVFGIYKGDEMIVNYRMATDKERSADEIGMLFHQFLGYEGIAVTDIEDVIISSVVPQVMYSLDHAIRKYVKMDPIVVGLDVIPDMPNLYENPSEVGADRIVNAIAGYEKYGGPLIIIDFGTATTFCAISEKGEYLGGVIFPGIKISMEALFQRAAKLPRVEIVKPEHIIGKNTVQSMQAGAVYGYAGSVDDIVKRMKEELGQEDVKVIATGGLSRLIASEASSIQKIDRNLTLFGLKVIYDRLKGR